MSFLHHLLSPLLVTCLLLAANDIAFGAPDSNSDDTMEKRVEALISWLKSKDGFIHDGIEMVRVEDDDPTSRFGTFATADIKAKETLLAIPYNLIIGTGGEENKNPGDPEDSWMECGVIRNLANHLRLEDNSHYAPYINYLLAGRQDSNTSGMLPSAWSKEGKDLFHNVLGVLDKERFMLPPYGATEFIDVDWRQGCNGSSDPLDVFAALLFVERNEDSLMIPLLDMVRHRNGEWLNADISFEGDDESVSTVYVQATIDIEAGEEIYVTFNMCETCDEKYNGTPEILRDYGFVEEYPQSWNFFAANGAGVNVRFSVDEEDDNEYTFEGWGDEVELNNDTIDDLKELSTQIVETRTTFLATRDPNVPLQEWNIINDYMTAMDIAVQVALDKVENDGETCIERGTCKVSTIDRYIDLEKLQFNYLDDGGYTCDVDAQFNVFEDGTFELLEEFKSPYQHISYMMDPKNKNTCFDLDDTVQICDSYRPHYHEMSVHNSARYINSIKRVLWVGGGDSMLLHEILKYPSLELAVGLELDQRVTRGAFKHFGTQPHFNNDKVQWWFGDATKSLMMLPKEYFGSFDMVLVDLSETVMSFKVTEGLDVMEALSLLVKPDGIFLKNEVYYADMKNMFPYTVQIHWYDNPMICSQYMVMGSRSVDFMKPNLTDHNVDGLFIRPLGSIDNPYDLYHDYARNYTSRTPCEIMAYKKNDGDTLQQSSSPGIILIVEVEDATVDLANAVMLESAFKDALKLAGLGVAASRTSEYDGRPSITILLREGYVVARIIPEFNYCGFDIHLWSSLDKQEIAKDELVFAVGSGLASLSVYRVIAGGMFGVASWEEEEKKRGPQYDEVCEETPQASGETSDEQNTYEEIDSMIAEAFSFLPSPWKRVAMLVGNENESNPISWITKKQRDALNIQEIVSMSCPMLVGYNEFDEGALDKLNDCEKRLRSEISVLAKEMKFDVLLIDSSADMLTASIILKIFSGRKEDCDWFFESDALVLSAIVEDEQEWRRNLVHLFKRNVFKIEPAYFVEESIGAGDFALNLLISSRGDPQFLQRLQNVMADLEKQNGLSTQTILIEGGEFIHQGKDWEPSRIFLPEDYDQSSPLQQWKSQKPLGHQVIFQMERSENSTESLSMPFISACLVHAIVKSAIMPVDSEKTFQNYVNIGEGCLLAFQWPGGSFMVLWDGRDHVDVNLFTYSDKPDEINAFELAFREKAELISRLRDEQPRGIGGIVSYFRDLEETDEPHWA